MIPKQQPAVRDRRYRKRWSGRSAHATLGLNNSHRARRAPSTMRDPAADVESLRQRQVCFRLVRARRWPTLRGMKPASIGPCTGTFSDPPTQSEMQSFAAYVESLRAAMAG